jgi:hypothetical protein
MEVSVQSHAPASLPQVNITTQYTLNGKWQGTRANMDAVRRQKKTYTIRE